jgi:curved DNA-binding protein
VENRVWHIACWFPLVNDKTRVAVEWILEKNHYQTLGIAPDADLAAIKLAYRRLARRFHPDISTEPKASEKFAEITEAYRALQAQEILRANRHKVQKSQTSPQLKEQPSKKEPPQKPQSAEKSEGGQAESRKQNQTTHTDDARSTETAADQQAEAKTKSKSKDCELTAYLSIEEFYWGADLKIDPSSQCPGRRARNRQPRQLLRLKINRGMQPGQRLRIRDPEQHSSSEDGSLYVTIKLKPHERYDVVDNHLYVDLPLSTWEAQSGAIVDVATPGGRIEVDVPAGISSGQTIRVPRRGLPKSASEAGDLLAVARIVSVDERTRKMQRWPHVPHKEVKHWRAVGGYKAGNSVDVFA